MLIWITGAPGSGKTALAKKLQSLMQVQILDGDEVRQWLTPDCDFSEEGRRKHAERVYRAAKMLPDAIVAVVAHPPGPVDCLIWVDGPNRKPLWEGTAYVPPENPDITVRTW